MAIVLAAAADLKPGEASAVNCHFSGGKDVARMSAQGVHVQVMPAGTFDEEKRRRHEEKKKDDDDGEDSSSSPYDGQKEQKNTTARSWSRRSWSRRSRSRRSRSRSTTKEPSRY